MTNWTPDLRCDHCGFTCYGDVESLTAGDRCPLCEVNMPGDEGTMRWIEQEDVK